MSESSVPYTMHYLHDDLMQTLIVLTLTEGEIHNQKLQSRQVEMINWV